MGLPNRPGTDARRMLLLNSWTLILESKRLMLSMLERRAQMGHATDAQSIARLHQELESAEAKRRVSRAAVAGPTGSEELDRTYESLIGRATACAEWLSTSARKLHPSQRLKAAVSVQMLEELVDQWRQDAAG